MRILYAEVMGVYRNEQDEKALKYRAAARLGLLDKLLNVGWAGLSPRETGQIGGMVGAMKRGLGKEK
ncbi:MAG: hypothetical protein IJ157_05045 [Clostridia bacterium]|nr:hypothetical protein [Clostridia bacterium]